MGVLDRLLLFIYALSVFLLSAGAIMLCTGIIPLDFLWTNFLYLCSRWETAAGAAVFLLLSLRFVAVSCQSATKVKKNKEAVVVQGKIGSVQVAVEAIHNMIEKTVRTVRCVRDVKVKVIAVDRQVKAEAAVAQQVKIFVQAVMGQEGNVVEVSDQIRMLVKENLQDVVGLSEFELEIEIRDISNAPLQKQRVV